MSADPPAEPPADPPVDPSVDPSVDQSVDQPVAATADRHRFGPVLIRATAVAAVLGLAVGGLLVLERRDDRTLAPPVQPALQPVALNGFGSCDEVLRYYRTQGAKRVGPYGLGSPAFAADGREIAATGGFQAPTAPRAAGDSAGSSAGNSAGSAVDKAAGPAAGSGTNVQVAGVDEADLMKVSGTRLVSVTEGVLRVSQLGSGAARVLGTLKLKGWYPDQLLLDGDQALLAGTAQPGRDGGVANDLAIRPNLTPTVRLAQLDLSDPAHPRVQRQLDVEGSLVGARLADGRVQLAVSTGAGRLPWVFPGGDGPKASERATASNRDLVRESGLSDWVPSYTARETRADGTPIGPTLTGRLVDCDKIAAPAVYSGLDTLSLLSIDLAGPGLRRWGGAAVVASGSTLYATATHTYVATSTWATLANDSTTLPDGSTTLPDGSTTLRGQLPRTEIHLFDTTDGVLQYTASGRVDGSLFGQFSMDEYQGRLRVASTVSTLTTSRSSDAKASVKAPTTRGRITVLQQDGDALKPVGTLDHLGEDETVQGVRFAGPLGYLVTYRQTDPLFTLDLADPRHPRKSGELKLLGYSAYLHPAGDGLLLGLGQDADAGGRTSGLQLSAFDVRNPAAPTRVGQVTLPGAWSGAQWDHHAFTMDGDLVLVPFSQDGGFAVAPTDRIDPTGKFGTHDAGVLAVRLVGRKLSAPVTLRPVGNGPVRVDYSKPDPTQDLALRAAPLRTAVVGGTVYTLTGAGIAAHNPATGARLGFTRW